LPRRVLDQLRDFPAGMGGVHRAAGPVTLMVTLFAFRIHMLNPWQSGAPIPSISCSDIGPSIPRPRPSSTSVPKRAQTECRPAARCTDIRNACNVLSAGIGRAPRAACRRDIGHSGSPALRRPSRKVFINFASKMGARRRRVEIVKRGSRRSRCATASRASLNRPSSTNETA
jgi:hypothetical protein